MSPILDLQQREMEQGRIRFGNKKGKNPNRLDHPLLTSADRALIEAVAAKYGGDVTEWPGGEGQWQTHVEGELSILLPVSPEPFTSWWERWSGGGCMRRCDGFTDTITGDACDCDKTAEKRACSATTRIAVLLPETGDARWRIETKSLNAALEIPGALDKAVGEKTGEVVEGVLRVEQRRGKKGTVPVPTITLTRSGAAPGEARALEAGPHIPAEGAVEPGEPVTPPGSPLISQKDIARIMAVCKEQGITEDELRPMVLAVCGVKSRKDIPADTLDALLAEIKNAGSVKRDAELADALFTERPDDVG